MCITETLLLFAVLQCMGEPCWNFAVHCCHVPDVLGDGTYHFCGCYHTLSLCFLPQTR
jgi:hypothetical protein